MNKIKCLADIDIGQSARVTGLCAEGSMRRRLLDIGLTQNTCVKCVGASPMGEPRAYLIRGAVIAIRKEDCKNILVCEGE